MVKSKTTDTGSRAEQSVQSEGQILGVQLADVTRAGTELSKEITQTETEIERTAAIVKATPDKIARAKSDYDAAFLAADAGRQTEAQARIRAANEERAAAVAKLGDFTKPLEELRDRQTTLRLKILDAVKATTEEKERIKREAQKARMQLDAVGHTGFKLTGIIASLRRHRPVTSEQSAVEPAAPEPPTKLPEGPSRADHIQSGGVVGGPTGRTEPRSAPLGGPGARLFGRSG
jgi:chromosome segregation ATPase